MLRRPRAATLRIVLAVAATASASCAGAPDAPPDASSGFSPAADRPWRGVLLVTAKADGDVLAWRVDGALQPMLPYLPRGVEVDTRALPDGEHTLEADVRTPAGTLETRAQRFRSANGQRAAPRFTGTFTDVTDASGLADLNAGAGGAGPVPGGFSPGAVAADFDGDGDVDVYAWSAAGGQLMLQDTPWSFRPVGELAPGVSAAGAGDLDNDGDEDLVTAGTDVRIYRNDGGVLTDATADTGFVPPALGHFTGVALADVDLDGLLDVALAQMRCSGAPNAVLRNEGEMRFVDVAEAMGVRSPDGATFAFAFDRMPGSAGLSAQVFREGCTTVPSTYAALESYVEPPRLRDETSSRSSPMGSAYFDADGDGALDLWFSGNYTNWLYRYPDVERNVAPYVGLDGYVGAAGSGPVTGWDVVLLDADMDGRADAFMVHDWLNPGDVPGHALFWHRDPGAMQEISALAGLAGEHGCRAAQGADLDGDGDTDLLLGCLREGVRLLRNDLVAPGPGRTVVLRGAVSNADGVHAVITSPTGEQRLSRGSGQPYAGGVVRESVRAPAGNLVVEWPSGIVQSVPAGSAAVLRVDEPAGMAVIPRRVAPGGAVEVRVDPAVWGRSGAAVSVEASTGSWAVPMARGGDGVFRGTLRAPDEDGTTVALRVTVGNYAVPIRPRVFVR